MTNVIQPNSPEMRQTLNTLMESQINVLRTIKTNELTWLYYYILLMSAAMGFFFAKPEAFKNNETLFWGLEILMVVVTLWMTHIMVEERSSYYRLYRSVSRIQYYLGLFGSISESGEQKNGFLHKSVLGAGFPKEYGFDKNIDGTKPGSSFRWRLIMILILYLVFLLVSYNQPFDYEYRLVLALTVVLFMAYCYCWKDKKTQKQDTKDEEHLLGFEKWWLPVNKKVSNNRPEVKKKEDSTTE